MKRKTITLLLTLLMSMVAQRGLSQTAVISYDGLYYSIDDSNGTAQLVNKEIIGNYTDNRYYHDYEGDIVIPEEITLPVDDIDDPVDDIDDDGGDYDHSFSFITSIDGEFELGFNHRSFRVISIGDAFKENYYISSVTLPNTITCIDDEAFARCYSLNSVVFGEDLETIGDNAFASCGLSSVTIPYGVTSIGERAFLGTSLTTLTIPSSVVVIGASAFVCGNLTSVTVESDTPLSITEDVFYNKANATLNVPLGFEKAYKEADCWKDFKEIVPTNFNIRFADSNLKTICVSNWDTDKDGELSLEEAAAVTSLGSAFKTCNWCSITFDELRFFTGLTSIGYDAFSRVSLKSVTIPINVTAIDVRAFDNYSLESIAVVADNEVYDSRNNCNAIIETSTNTLVIGINTSIIPSGIKKIGTYAFKGCSRLSTISIPYGVTSIGVCAFESSGLTQVSLPSSVYDIDWYAFRYTPWEDSQPDGLIYAGKVAYLYKGTMPQNTSITIKNGTIGIAGGAFDETGSNNLTSVAIPATVTTIGRYAFHGTKLTNIDFPESAYRLGLSVFGNTPWIESQPNGLIYMGKVAYRYKGSVTDTKIVIKEGTKGIAGDAFMYQGDLVSITIPFSVEYIGERAFVDCNSLVEVIMDREEPLEIIDGQVFTNRTNATLYVPFGCSDAYKAAPYWKEFKEIKELPDGVHNAIKVNDYTVCQGGQATLPIAMNNVEQIVGFQFDLQLPEGVTVATNANGTLAATLTDRVGDHSLSVSKVGDGLYRFISVSMSNNAFADNEGTLLNVKLLVDESVAVGDYEVKVTETKLTTASKEEIRSVDGSALLTVQDAAPGDVNGDMKVSVSDVASIIGYILNDKPAIFITKAADLNHDNSISVTDAVLAIDIILSQGNADGSRMKNNTIIDPQ